MPKNKVVSVQDDEVLNRVLLREINNEKFEVYEVDNGREGLVMIRDHKPVLVILDPLVPEIDGFTMLQELRGDDETKDIPVIVISILAGEGDIKKFLDLGVEEYIVKSQTPMFEIIQKVKYHLDNKAK